MAFFEELDEFCYGGKAWWGDVPGDLSVQGCTQECRLSPQANREYLAAAGGTGHFILRVIESHWSLGNSEFLKRHSFSHWCQPGIIDQTSVE